MTKQRDKRIIAVNSNCYHGFSIDEALDGIQRAGFHYVELTATKGWTEHVFPDQSFESLSRLQYKMEDMGIVPFAMSGHCNLMDHQRLQDFIENIKLAAFFGCDYIVSSVGEAHLQDKEKGGTDLIVRNLDELMPYLERYQMQLVLETHGEHATAAPLKEIVDRMHSDLVGINYDTANAIFYGDVDPAEDIQKCMDEVTYMHLKDKAGDKKVWDFPTLGKGYVDFPKIFDLLEKAGNTCPFSIEIEFTQEGPENLQAVDQAVQEAAEYLTKQGFIL